MNILLIDKRIQEYETIVAAIDPALAVGVVFDYYEDTFDTVKARIGALGLMNETSQISVGLIQHNYRAPLFSMMASADVAPIAQVSTQDPHLMAWTQIRDFITWCKTEFNAAHFDMMACALYSDPDWKYVIDTLTAQTGVTVRASTDDTGAASLGGDWFLESHTGVNLKTVYFTEAIEAYRGVLYIGYYLSVTNRDYSTKAVVASNVITWGNSSVSSSSVASSLSSGVVAVYSTEEAFAALKTTGNVITWGLSGGDSSSVTSSLVNVVNIYSNRFAFAALKSDGSIVAWGNSSAGGTAPSSVTAANSGVVAVYNTLEAFAALKSDGRVVAWGSSDYGAHTAPSTVTAANSNVVAIYSNNAFVALKSDGSIVQWGHYIDPPSSVTDANSGVVVVYVTGGTFAALKSDGSVIVWGGGLVSGLAATDVISVFYNSGALVGLKSNGSVVQLGASGGAPSSVTAANSGVVSVCSTTRAFAALKIDGTVVAWGETYQGGTAPSSVTNANSGVVALYTAHDGFIALKSDGSVDMWGQLIPRTNISGQYSSVSSRLTSGIVAAYTGVFGNAALKNTGEVVTWGESDYGIGNSSSVSSSFGSGVIAMNLIYPQNNNRSGGAALKTAATTFDLSMSYYSNMDRYNILRKKENRRRVNLTILNNNVFTLSTVRDIQSFNHTIPSGEPLRIIVPDYVSSPLSITSTATIPSGLSSVIIACDECEPVTISGTTYVNYGTFVYTLNASGSYVKTTSTTINQRPYSVYGGDGFRSSGIALLDARTVPTLSSTTFSVASSKTFGDASFNIITVPTSNSDGVITYSSSNTAVATIDASGTWITLVGAGDVNFIATQEGNATYAGATKTSNTLTVERGTTTLARTAMDATISKTFGIDISFNVVATSDSSGAVTYTSSAPEVATVGLSTGLVTPVSAGQTTITAQQAQSAQYNVPTSITSVLTVLRGTTSLTSFSVADSKTFGYLPFSTTAPTSDSSGAITYSSNDTDVATINPSSGIITLVAVGTATFTASQAQSAQYNAPTPVTSNTLTVIPSGASSGAVTYTSSNPAVATVGLTTGLVTPVDIGSVTITATQAASSRYNAPTNTTFTMTIGAPANLAGTVVTTSLASKNLTGASFENTVLANVSLAGATLSGVNFSGATITGANFTNANIVGATNLPVFSTTQKLQLLRNSNNVEIGAVQISAPISGADLNAAISNPLPEIAAATFVVKAPAYNANNEKVVTISTADVSGNASIYIPLNDNETININGVAYTFNGTNVLDANNNVITFLTVLNKPFRLYAGSIIGLNVVEKMNNVRFADGGFYDILSEFFVFKN